MLIDNIPPRLLDREEAINLAHKLNETEDACGWSYRPYPAKVVGKYHVEVQDEYGRLGDL